MKDKIIRALVESGGYRQVSGPLRVVDTDFASDFDAVLVGPGEQGCLIVVVDSDHVSPPVIQRRVRSFALVLDRTGSRRPLTVILIARTPRTFEALEKMCRIVVITPDDEVLSALRGLLPLRIQSHEQTLNAAEDALSTQLGQRSRNTLIAGLLKAANAGSSNVEQEILRAIDVAIGHALPRSGSIK